MLISVGFSEAPFRFPLTFKVKQRIGHSMEYTVPKLQSARGQPRNIDGFVLLHHCIGDLCTRVCFGIARKIVVKILLDRPFIVRFMGAICLSEQKVILRNSPPAAIIKNNQQSEKESNM